MSAEARAEVVLRGARVALPTGTTPADIAITEGRIAAVAPRGSLMGRREVDAEDRLVLPGLVDSHVHVRDPGQTHKEDFLTASRAAASGGITTILAMPNTDPPVTSQAQFEAAAQAGSNSIVDFGLQALAHGSNLSNIADLARLGVVSFEMFLGGGPDWLLTRDAQTQHALFAAVAETGLVMGLYADDPDASAVLDRGGDRASILRAHPPAIGAGRLLIALSLAADAGCRVHVRQVSSGLAALAVSWMRRTAMPGRLTAEATPHHLALTSGDSDRFGPYGHIMPPLREPEDVDALWDAIRTGAIATIGSDHSPHGAAEKAAGGTDLRRAPPGFPGLETFLPAMLTETRERGFSEGDFIRLAAETPARLFGLYPRKGVIREGADADLIVVDDGGKWMIEPKRFQSKAKYSPFEGRAVTARVDMTLVRGTMVFDGEPIASGGHGQLVHPDRAGR